jgi:signal transduction histidine kinase
MPPLLTKTNWCKKGNRKRNFLYQLVYNKQGYFLMYTKSKLNVLAPTSCPSCLYD